MEDRRIRPMSSPRCRSSALGPICGVRLCCLACFCSLLPTLPLHPHQVLFFFSFFSSVVSLSQRETNIRPHPLGAFRCIPTAGRHPPFRCQAMSILPFWPTVFVFLFFVFFFWFWCGFLFGLLF